MALQTQLLEFNSSFYKHSYLCNYRPRFAGGDELSRSLIHFKRGHPLHVKAWTECAVSELEKARVHNGSLILRALGHQETEVQSEMPLDILGNELAERFDALYRPYLLKKLRTTQKITQMNRSEREEELLNLYSFEGVGQVKEVLIIDDILTTGATVRAMISAIKSIIPSCAIQIFTLASTDRDAVMNQSIQLASSSYEWQQTIGWQQVAEEQESYSDLMTLKNAILHDAFK